MRHGSEVDGAEEPAGSSVPPPARVVQQPVRRESPKVGRNDPCPCGSGEKFKKCHGAALEEDGGDATV